MRAARSWAPTDRPGASGYGHLPEWPEACIVTLSEHHAVVALDDVDASVTLPELGDRLRVVPNHVCSAVNLVLELIAARGDRLIDRWPVAARGANT